MTTIMRTIITIDHDHSHESGGERLDYGAGVAGVHVPGLSQERIVQIERDILAKNRSLCRREPRGFFARKGVLALNLVSSPGSGKTSLLVRAIDDLKDKHADRGDRGRPADLQRRRAHPRHRRAGDPGQYRQGLPSRRPYGRPRASRRWMLADDSLLFIENVGNLVCPAAFDLGEAHKVVVLSVTEGEDKPAQISRHVRRRRPDAAQQVRPAAASRFRCRRLPRPCLAGQSQPANPGGFGENRRGPRGLLRLDRGARRIGEKPGAGAKGRLMEAAARRGARRDDAAASAAARRGAGRRLSALRLWPGGALCARRLRAQRRPGRAARSRRRPGAGIRRGLAQRTAAAGAASTASRSKTSRRAASAAFVIDETRRGRGAHPHSPPTPRPAKTASTICSTRRAAFISIPSSIAPIAARATPSPGACPMTAPRPRWRAFAMCADCARDYADPTQPPLPRRADRLPGLRPALCRMIRKKSSPPCAPEKSSR